MSRKCFRDNRPTNNLPQALSVTHGHGRMIHTSHEVENLEDYRRSTISIILYSFSCICRDKPHIPSSQISFCYILEQPRALVQYGSMSMTCKYVLQAVWWRSSLSTSAGYFIFASLRKSSRYRVIHFIIFIVIRCNSLPVLYIIQ